MYFPRKAAFMAAFSLVFASCSGGSYTGPPANPPAQPQSLSRAEMGSDGNVRVMLYTKDFERSGRIVRGVDRAPRLGAATSSSNLLYNGGPIQPTPRVYVTYWGNWGSTGDPRAVQPYLNNFLTNVGGSSWLNTVTQYTQTGGARVGNAGSIYYGPAPSGQASPYWNDTSTIPSLNNGSTYQNLIAAEAQKAAAHFNDYSVSASYVIAIPHAVKVYQFAGSGGWMCYFFGCYCAWHSSTTANGSTIAYTNLPYIPDAGTSCGANDPSGAPYDSGVSIVEGHEQAETETDPQLNAWYDSSGSEIGDKCAWVNVQQTAFSSGTFSTQPLWSNASASCVQHYP